MPKTGNIVLRLSDISRDVIEFPAIRPQFGGMKQTVALSFALTLALALPAQAACYADYKAKQEQPLRLHYGVAEVGDPCNTSDATQKLQGRLAAQGWILLNVMSVFGEDGLAERKESAGPHFLRY